jgi:hypothetical protein
MFCHLFEGVVKIGYAPLLWFLRWVQEQRYHECASIRQCKSCCVVLCCITLNKL